MKLSGAYLAEHLKNIYQSCGEDGISGDDGYLRPLFYENTAKVKGHVVIAGWEDWKEQTLPEGSFWILLRCPKETEVQSAHGAVYLALERGEEIEVLNAVQQLYDTCDSWVGELRELMLSGGSVQQLLELSHEMFGNPLAVMGMDFTLIAEAGTEGLREEQCLFVNETINIEYMNAYIQDETYMRSLEAIEPMILPAFIGGYRTMSLMLWTQEAIVYRVVVSEVRGPLTEGQKCLLKEAAIYLEYLLLHAPIASKRDDLDDICRSIVSDRTADYMVMSSRLAAHDWSSRHEYLCMVIQLTSAEQDNTAGTICKYIKKEFQDASSFQKEKEIVSFFNLTRMGLTEEEAESKLICFIRDSFLKAGYSRTMQGHMNLRRQYLQARIALDVGRRHKPYVWVHKFNQMVLPYLMEQCVRTLPGQMICHEHLLELKRQDEIHETEYMLTLKTYLEQNLNATQTANELYIHRSTFLYRLEKIKAVLQSNLDDPEEIFYLNFSMRLLEQEEHEQS